MNYNENSKPTLESTILNSIRGSLVDTHTTLIAKITKVNQKTIDCKPVISRLVNDKAVDLPTKLSILKTNIYSLDMINDLQKTDSFKFQIWYNK